MYRVVGIIAFILGSLLLMSGLGILIGYEHYFLSEDFFLRETRIPLVYPALICIGIGLSCLLVAVFAVYEDRNEKLEQISWLRKFLAWTDRTPPTVH